MTRPLVLAAISACVLLSATQFWAIGRVELTFDEAYYVLWSRNLAWGYFDHPPMIAAWIRASTALFGSSELGARALNALFFAAEPALIAFIAWRLFACAEVAAFSALMWVSMPLVAGAVIVTPDAPLVIFWTLALAGLGEVWRGRSWGWLVVGAALGLALLSKFTAAFAGVGVVFALAAVPSLRPQFRRPAPYLAALLAAAIFAPFVIWNAGHGWATFAKQLARVPAHGFAPRYLLEFLGVQIGLMNPLTFAAAVAAVVAGLRAGAASRAGEADRLLMATIAPALAYFLIHALHDRVQGNWPAPLYPALAILAARAVAQARAAGATPTYGHALVAAVGRYAPPIGLVVAALAYAQAATALLPLGRFDPTTRIGGWRGLTAEVDARAQGAAFILARGYAATSLLTYYGVDSPPVLQRDERDRWLFEPPPSEALFDKPGLAFAEAGKGFDAELSSHFGHVEEIARLSRRHGAAEVGAYTLYRVSDPIPPVLGPD